MRPKRAAFMLTTLCLATPALALDRVSIGGFAIDRTEVSIGQFRKFATATKTRTAAEKSGGGYEWMVAGNVARVGL